MSGQPPGDEHLLLVAAGQVLDELVRVGGADVELLHILVDDLVRFLLRDRLEHAANRLQGDEDVLTHRQVADDAFVSTVLRGVGDAVLQRGVRIVDGDTVAVELVGAGFGLVRAVEQTSEFGASGAEQSRETHDLAGVDVEVGRLDGALAARALDGHDRLLVRADGTALLLGADLAEFLGALADHHADELVARRVLGHDLLDELAVAQDGQTVGDLIDLVKEVGDEQDRHTGIAHLAHDGEEVTDLVGVERGGRFVGMSTLASMTIARAMATSCCMAMEMELSGAWGRGGPGPSGRGTCAPPDGSSSS